MRSLVTLLCFLLAAPALAQAQVQQFPGAVRVNATGVGTVGGTIRADNGVPDPGLGNPTDLYLRRDAPYGVYFKDGTGWHLIGAVGPGTIDCLSKFVTASTIGDSMACEVAGILTIDGSASVVAGEALRTAYSSGWSGAGYVLDYDRSFAGESFMELDRLSVRGIMNVYELLVHQIRATNGSIFVANTGKVCQRVDPDPDPCVVDNGGGSYTLQTETAHGFEEDDLIRAQRFTGTGVYQSDLTVTAVASDTEFTATLRATYTVPAAGMEFVRLGSTTNTDRQGSIYLTADDTGAPYINVLDGVDSFEAWGTAAKVKVRVGNQNGAFGIATDIYGLSAGDSAATNILANATHGFQIRFGTGCVFCADTSGNLSLTGNLTIGTAGALMSGATAYGTGTGYWLDYNAGTPRFRIGTVSGNRLVWTGTEMVVQSEHLLVDSTGVGITLNNSTSYASSRAYRFTGSALGGNIGFSAGEGGSLRYAYLNNTVTSGSAFISINATSTNATASLTLTSDWGTGDSAIQTAGHFIPGSDGHDDIGDPVHWYKRGFIQAMQGTVFNINTITAFGGYNWVVPQAGNLAAAVALDATTIDFGTTMTPTHWVVIAAQDTSEAYRQERILVGTNVSGTTYNVTRDQTAQNGAAGGDGWAWAAGTPWVSIGASGSGRVEINVFDGKPMLRVVIQGATAAAQTNVVQIGDLTGFLSVPSGKLGIGIGTAGQSLTFYDGNLTISGTVTATAGAIGGFNIGADYIRDVAGVVGMSSAVTGGDDIRFWAGHATMASAPFYVTEAGVIKAVSGNVGGWNLATNSLSDATGVVGMSSAVTGGDDIRFWAGDATPANAEFSVTEAGVLKATSGTVGGWTLSPTVFSDLAGVSGLSSAVTGGDDVRIWAGAGTPASAPFRVTEAGVVVATSATIAGTITATAGFFGGFAIGATNFNDAAGVVGMSSAVTGGTDVRIWAGGTNPTTAPFRVYENGDVYGNQFYGGIIGTVTVVGAASALSIGESGTSPTSPTAGTGLWLNKDGIYGLNANVQQAVFSADTGKITAGAGAVIMDADGFGISLAAGGSPLALNSYKFIDGSIEMRLAGYKSTKGSIVARHMSLNLAGGDSDDTSVIQIAVQDTADSASINLTAGGAGAVNIVFDADKHEFIGDVGMGVSTPANKLHVSGAGSAAICGGCTSVATFLTTDALGAGVGAGIALGGVYQASGSLQTGFAQVKGIKENATDTNYAGALTLWTRSNGGSLTEKMRIDSVGLVGIGVTPSTLLHVKGTTPVLRVEGSGGTITSLDLYYGSNSGARLVYDPAIAVTYLVNDYHATQTSQVYGSIYLQTKRGGTNTLVTGLMLDGYRNTVGINTVTPGPHQLMVNSIQGSSVGDSGIKAVYNSGSGLGSIEFCAVCNRGSLWLGGYFDIGSGSYSLYASGNAYFTADVSALTFTDRTPFYDGDALAELGKVKGKNGKIDHDSLPPFARVKRDTERVDPATGVKTTHVEDGRDLGAMISVLTKAAQQLDAKVKVKDAEVEALRDEIRELRAMMLELLPAHRLAARPIALVSLLPN